MEILNSIKTIFIVEKIALRPNGIHLSIIKKMELMEERWGYKSLMLVTEHSPHLSSAIANRLDKSNVISVYEYLQQVDRTNKKTAEPPKNPGEKRKVLKNNVHSIFNDSGMVRNEHYYTNGTLAGLDYYENGSKIRTDLYDDYGNISSSKFYDTFDNNYHPVEEYYRPDGKLCIKVEYKPIPTDILGKTHEITKLSLYDNNGSVTETFASNAELAAYCLAKILEEHKDKVCLLVVEDPMYVKTALLQKQKNVIKTCLIHSAFLQNPYELSGETQYFYTQLCSHANEFDALVFLTETEREDFIKLYGNVAKTFTIAHMYAKDISKVAFEERDTKKAVIVSRFDPVKRIEVAIDIFRRVVEEVPDAELEIYGAGKEEDKYKQHIKKLGLEDNVFIKGYTEEAATVFSEAVLSMATSYIEGFMLTVMESICNGCPVFSLDIKYGPSDIIANNKTGFIFARDDKITFAKKLVAYFNDTALQRKMSENAYSDAWRFSPETFLENWFAFMETMYYDVIK